MPGPRFVAFSGSWSRPSKTRSLIEEAAQRAVARFGGTSQIFDIVDLGPDFGSLSQPQSTIAAAHRRAFVEADALIVASPVFKGSYTGLFKHFVDLLAPEDLAGKPVLLAATGGGARHALMIEHQLRPLFGFFEAATLATGIYASEADFEGGRLASQAALTRLDRAVAQFSAHLSHFQAAQLRAVS